MGSIKPYKTIAFICITDNVSVNILTPKIGGLGPCCSFFSLGPVLVQSVCFLGCTLPKTNSSRLKIGLFTPQKELIYTVFPNYGGIINITLYSNNSRDAVEIYEERIHHFSGAFAVSFREGKRF